MPKITEGNKLYLYQLLSRELGMGKQALLPRVEEVLAADDILPEDLNCTDIQQLMEACPDFIRITTFKKGRVFATVVRNPSWDKLLEASDTAPDTDPKPKKGGKPWKAKAAAKKGTKPAKPRNKERKQREAREAAAAAEAARAEAEAEAKAEAEARAKAEEEARAQAEAQAREQARLKEEAQAREEAAALAEKASIPSLAEQVERERARLGITDDDDAQQQPTPAQAPRRRVGRFASALAQDAREEVQPKPEEQPEPAALSQQEPAPGQRAHEDETASLQQDAPRAEQAQTNEAPADQPNAAQEPAKAPAPVEKQPPAAHEPSIKFTITYDPSQDEPAEQPRSQKPVVHAEEFEHNSLPKRAPRRTHPGAQQTTPRSADMPESFSREVHARDELLRMLYQMLPVDADVTRVLEEDWRVARSTSTLSGNRAKVTFPLRYQHDDGTPVEVTLRRASKQVAGKSWNLAYIDGDDGTGSSHAAVGLEGLPAADEGAWSDLSGDRFVDVSPARELAQFAVLGTWDAVLGGLAAQAEPERWNYPGEGVGKASRLSILREYLTVTFHRAQEQGRVAIDVDETFATFNTGLLTPFAQDIYACFTPHRGDIAWAFAGFATVGTGDVGGQLGALFAQPPKAPSYLASIDDVVAQEGRSIILDTDALLSRQLGRLPRAFLSEQLEGNTIAREVLEQELADGAMDRSSVEMLARTIKGDPGLYRRMSRALSDAVEFALKRSSHNYRLAAPAYDPVDGRIKLLLPLCLVNDAQADCAAVLDLQRSGAYRVTSVMSLTRAYACARVVSAEMPGWLAADKVLR